MSRKKTQKKKARSAKPAAPSVRAGKSPIDTAVLDVLIGFNVRRAMAALRRSYFRHVWSGQMRPGLASLLQLVATNQGASQVELSRALHVDEATLVALIDDAESEGWLSRQRSNTDRRRHEVIITPKGEKVVEELARQTLSNEEIFRSRFTETELADFLEYLQRIYRT